MKKWMKRTLAILAMLLVVVTAAGFWAGNFFYNLALNPHSDKSSVLNAKHNEVDYDEAATEKWRENLNWLDGVGYTQVQMDSRDGLKLHGYLLENDDPAANWVVIFHGYNSAARVMADFARAFYERGYNLLLPDARGCGGSEGAYMGMGWDDRLDALDWVARLNARYQPRNVVLYGVSMGGATVMMASGEALPDNVRAIVEDSGYASVKEEFAYQCRQLYGIPAFPVLNYSSAVTRIRAGFWLGDADAVKQVQKSITPTLFIHGENDAFVPAAMAEQVYAAAACEKELLVMPNAGHGGAANADPARYWGTVEAFVGRYLI